MAELDEKRLEGVLEEVSLEVKYACKTFPTFNSNHEGYAVIKEELDELWDLIKKGHPQESNADLKAETIQLAAMAVRYVLDRTEQRA